MGNTLSIVSHYDTFHVSIITDISSPIIRHRAWFNYSNIVPVELSRFCGQQNIVVSWLRINDIVASN